MQLKFGRSDGLDNRFNFIKNEWVYNSVWVKFLSKSTLT